MFETVVSISLAVPSKVRVSVPTVTTSSEPLSPPIVNAELVAAVDTAVNLPCASTVITGIVLAEPYDPADTAVLSKLCVTSFPETTDVIPVPPERVNVSASVIAPVPESPAMPTSVM